MATAAPPGMVPQRNGVFEGRLHDRRESRPCSSNAGLSIFLYEPSMWPPATGEARRTNSTRTTATARRRKTFLALLRIRRDPQGFFAQAAVRRLLAARPGLLQTPLADLPPGISIR